MHPFKITTWNITIIIVNLGDYISTVVKNVGFLTRHPHPSPMPVYVSVPLEVSKCQIQRHFGWWYAIDRGRRMFPNCTSIT